MAVHDLKGQIARLAEQPGVYLFLNAAGDTLYVGKARVLRDRVRSYLGAGGMSPRIDALLRDATALEVIVTDSVVEALALENRLIKQRNPRFNILLRDDKTYPYLQLTTAEAAPRLLVARRVERDGNVYAGPFMPAAVARRTMSLSHRLFGIRSCNEIIDGQRGRPCLEYDIKRCLAPCVAAICTLERYRHAVDQTQLLIEGRQDELIADLQADMAGAAAVEEFERAAQLRDAVRTLETLRDRTQKMETPSMGDRDAFGLKIGPAGAIVQVFQVRHGRVVDRLELINEGVGPRLASAGSDPLEIGPRLASAGSDPLEIGPRLASAGSDPLELGPRLASAGSDPLEIGPRLASAGFDPLEIGPRLASAGSDSVNAGSDSASAGSEPVSRLDAAEVLEAALRQAYADRTPPPEIHVPDVLDDSDRDAIETWLSAQAGRRVRVMVPRRGEKRGLLTLAERNAGLAYQSHFHEGEPAAFEALDELRGALALPTLPRRIECFDISTLQGRDTVASMVVAVDGQMRRQEYRKFRIRGLAAAGGAATPPSMPDDFAAMHEVVLRRYRRLLEHGGPFPDLVLIDGGKGQLTAAYDALRELGLERLVAVGLAKQEELLFTRDRVEGLALPRESAALRLVQRVRDEAHRFAVTFHRQQRRTRDMQSVLDAIPGVGPRRRRQLLRAFGSIAGVRRASRADLEGIVGAKVADAVIRHFG